MGFWKLFLDIENTNIVIWELVGIYFGIWYIAYLTLEREKKKKKKRKHKPHITELYKFTYVSNIREPNTYISATTLIRSTVAQRFEWNWATSWQNQRNGMCAKRRQGLRCPH